MDVARAVELYADGVPMRVIANELGVAESTVSRKLRQAGVQTHRAKRSPFADSDIIRLRMEGKLWPGGRRRRRDDNERGAHPIPTDQLPAR